MPVGTFSFQEPIAALSRLLKTVGARGQTAAVADAPWSISRLRRQRAPGASLPCRLVPAEAHRGFDARGRRPDHHPDSCHAQMAGSRHHRYQPADHRAAADGRGGRRKDRTAAGSDLRAGQARRRRPSRRCRRRAPRQPRSSASALPNGARRGRTEAAPGLPAIPRPALAMGGMEAGKSCAKISDKAAISFQNTALLRGGAPRGTNPTREIVSPIAPCDREETT